MKSPQVEPFGDDPEAAFDPPRWIPQESKQPGVRSWKWAGQAWEPRGDCAPEADMVDVANGDFSGLSEPILVACRDQEQLEAFIWKNALFCLEVRRLQGMRTVLSKFPENKILLILPGCWEDPEAR